MAEMGFQGERQRTGFFHSGKTQQQPDLNAFSEDISNLSRRLRLLEESVTNLRRSSQVIEQNMLSKNKTYNTEIKTINSDISEIKREIAEVKEKMLDMLKEVRECARRDELKVLEKYINFWNPVKFVTQNEVEIIVNDIIKKNMPIKNIKNINPGKPKVPETSGN